MRRSQPAGAVSSRCFGTFVQHFMIARTCTIHTDGLLLSVSVSWLPVSPCRHQSLRSLPKDYAITGESLSSRDCVLNHSLSLGKLSVYSQVCLVRVLCVGPVNVSPLVSLPLAVGPARLDIT